MGRRFRKVANLRVSSVLDMKKARKVWEAMEILNRRDFYDHGETKSFAGRIVIYKYHRKHT